MTQATVVIGAGYGDEGKGRVVDFICGQNDPSKTIVVRFNGGAQASHTVVRNGIRHAYSHFGSGTTYGCVTYLAEKFILNPFVFRDEYNQLQSKGITPKVYVNPKCIVTTIFDMLANQFVEIQRGENRHGSCGLGINNTVNRNLSNKGFTLEDLHIVNGNLEYFVKQSLEYYPKEIQDSIYDENMMKAFVKDFEFMMDHIILDYGKITLKYDYVVFEGAQGLQLDEDSRNFPHVTRSKTGLAYIKETLKNFRTVEVIYVTRAYQTKHGAGPFEYEQDLSEWFDIVDKTNVFNPFQHGIRYAPIDIFKLFKAITGDISRNYVKGAKHSLAMTCLDQSKGFIPEIVYGKVLLRPKLEFINMIDRNARGLGFSRFLKFESE